MARSRDHELESSDRQAAEARKGKDHGRFCGSVPIGAGPTGKGMCFTVADEEVAIINVDGTIYAMKGSCLHKGASLGTGELDGKVVTCRAPRLALKPRHDRLARLRGHLIPHQKLSTEKS